MDGGVGGVGQGRGKGRAVAYVLKLFHLSIHSSLISLNFNPLVNLFASESFHIFEFHLSESANLLS